MPGDQPSLLRRRVRANGSGYRRNDSSSVANSGSGAGGTVVVVVVDGGGTFASAYCQVPANTTAGRVAAASSNSTDGPRRVFIADPALPGLPQPETSRARSPVRAHSDRYSLWSEIVGPLRSNANTISPPPSTGR